MDDERCWQVVAARDDSCAASFVYAVLTTGIFCRPGCPARLPQRENIKFFPDAATARMAGYRPCRRCLPDKDSAQEEQARKIVAACRLLESCEEEPVLAQLAEAAAMSPRHLHREFKRMVGVTPKQYASYWRTRRFQALLEEGATVTEAVYGAGYGSSSGPYRSAREGLGMAPGAYRQGGRGETLTCGTAPCFLGWLVVVASARGVCAVEFGDDQEELLMRQRQRFSQARLIDGDGDFSRLVQAVVQQIAQPARAITIPLDIRGTVFELQVWNALRQIPPGTTISYSELAERIGRPRAVRAVAGACGRNAIAGLVPCHRAVAKDGRLAGYRWGLERKRRLLAAEQSQNVDGDLD